jgi:O-antigen/teichoic acid export membrane protein
VKRKFTSSLILLLSLNLIVKPFWIFGIDRTVQNIVGAGEYGLFFALFNFSMLLNITLDFGLTSFNNREISQHPQLLPRYLSNMVVMKFLLAFVYLIVSFSIALFIGYTGRQLWILGVLVFNQFLSSFILYLRSNVSGLQLFKTDSLLSVADRVLMIILCSILLWGPLRSEFTIEWFVYAQSIAYLATASIAFFFILRKAEFFSLKFERAFFLSIIKQSMPFALLALLMSFHYRVDSVMLERMLPDGHIQSGIYAQAFRLLDASTMVPFLFATLLLPIFSKMLRSGESILPILGFALSLLLVVSITFSLACIGYRVPLINLLYLNNTEESSQIFALLMGSFIFISISYIIGTLLTANGNLKQLNIIALFGGILNLVLNLIFIPLYKVYGAAISSLVTQAIISILQVILVTKLFNIRIPLALLIKFCIFVVTLIGVYYLFSLFEIKWIYGLISICIIGVVVALILKIIRLKEIILLYSNPA